MNEMFQRRGLTNIRWYEYAFLALGIIAALVSDGLTIVRLVKLGSLDDPDFAYGILILVHSGRTLSLKYLCTSYFCSSHPQSFCWLF